MLPNYLKKWKNSPVLPQQPNPRDSTSTNQRTCWLLISVILRYVFKISTYSRNPKPMYPVGLHNVRTGTLNYLIAYLNRTKSGIMSLSSK